MQQRPDPSTVLDALAEFLLGEVAPRLEDKALSFRVLIAAHLASTVGAELRTAEARYEAEATRLQALLPGVLPGDATRLARSEERQAALNALTSALCERLRSPQLSAAELEGIRAHLKASSRATLAVLSPRFDTSDDPESAP